LINIHTRPDSGSEGNEFIFDETADYSKFRANNLTERRFWGPVLSAGEVADNLRAAKGPEPAASAAKDRLAQSFHRMVLKEAQNHSDAREGIGQQLFCNFGPQQFSGMLRDSYIPHKAHDCFAIAEI
jgi:hypothetical protein